MKQALDATALGQAKETRSGFVMQMNTNYIWRYLRVKKHLHGEERRNNLNAGLIESEWGEMKGVSEPMYAVTNKSTTFA